jgi:O-antigen/teichoic acid export membrane protein
MATVISTHSGRPLRRDAVKRYAASIVSQGALSAFSFALGIFMLRVLSLEDFGLFSLVLIAANVFTGITNALAATPLLVYAPALVRRRERVRMEATLATANAALTAALTGATALGCLLFRPDAGFVLSCAAFVATFCFRHYWRVFAFARRQPETALATDLVYVGLGVVAVGGAAAATGGQIRLDLALATLSAATVCSMVPMKRRLALGFGLPVRRFMPTTYRRVWDECRWSLLGVVTTSVQTQAHSFVVTAFAGPAAFAPLAAGNALFGPMRMTVAAWQMVARPDFAIAIERGDDGAVRRALRTSTALLLAGNATFMVCLYGLWDFMDAHLFQQKYADQPMPLIVALWAAVTAVTTVRGVVSGAVQAYREFRPLAWATVYGGAVSLAVAAALFFAFGPAVSLAGVLAGEVLVLVRLMRLHSRRRSASCPP